MSKLTELQFLDEKIKYEKAKVYSNGIKLMPGITTLTLGALTQNDICLAIGTAVTLGGVVIKKDNKKLIKKQTNR